MTNRDDELEKLLKPLKELLPNDLQMMKWQMAVKQELHKSSASNSTTRSKWALQLVAAMLVGVIIGALLFRNTQPPAAQMIEQISLNDATFEHSHSNLD
jgi:F0F1-type ATP synthase assembly protein I